jgi:hypothetical protein
MRLSEDLRHAVNKTEGIVLNITKSVAAYSIHSQKSLLYGGRLLQPLPEDAP